MNSATKYTLQDWILEALQSLNGSATLLDVCKQVWCHHEAELKASGDLFYSWQYDIRWAATVLRERKLIKAAEESPRGIWELVPVDDTSSSLQKTA
jgi:hypothetical protein